MDLSSLALAGFLVSNMAELDVIIPVHNEAGSVAELVRRIDASLTDAGIDYNVIFVDDYSTDETARIIEKVSCGNIIYEASDGANHPDGSRIKLLPKKGRQGKAFSILEGARVGTAAYIAMIDGDLQYPPEAIPLMYKLAQKHGVVVANRKNYENSWLRGEGSKINKFLFERLLLGFKCDTQSGLKVFKKEIINHLAEENVGPWTLDMPLLAKALELGYEIGTVDINFTERKSGKSKVNFLKTALEIAASAIKLKFAKKRTYTIGSKEKRAVGAGIIHQGRRFTTHTLLENEKSALETFKSWQKIALALIVGTFLLGLAKSPLFTGILVVTILSIVYFLDLLFSFYLLLKNLSFPCETKVKDSELKSLKEETLPIYSILCPLYKEANILPQFIAAIEALDWPKEKLDVILVLEEDDEETINAAKELELPDHFRILVVPHASPKTKPKACNFGLAQAKGEYIVIYDAEDRPEPMQLKKAYIAFAKVGPKVVCLQSKLNYYNSHDNLLSRLFTAEYSLWFDLVLPGLQSINTTIPLGGTSNHFKTHALRYLDAWDPFNVTEDCDLGARLYKAGLSTAIIDSTTYEEANSKIGSWLRQRSRWIKGYLQTYLVHMRDPLGFVRRHGVHALIFQLVIGARMTFLVVNPILWATTASYFVAHHLVGPTIEALYPAPIFYIAVVSIVFGNFFYLYSYMIGCAKRGQWELVKYVFFIPFYWFLASVAATKAFYQLISAPYYWEKTQHGIYLAKQKPAPSLRFVPQITVGLPQFISNLGTILASQMKVSFDFGKVTDAESFAKVFGVIYEPIFFIVRQLTELVDLFSKVAENDAALDGKMKMLLFNWRDTKHIWAGGAEVYIHELAKRWVASGHSVTLFCGWDGKTKRNETVEGVTVIRRGGFYTVYPLAALYYLLKFRRKYDVVVDCENGVPFFTPLFTNIPSVLLIHHVHQEVFRQHLRLPLAQIALFLESRLMPTLYKNQPIVTISESSKRDIVDRGWSEVSDVGIVTPGIEAAQFRQSGKTDEPSFVYLGRLKAYKNVDSCLAAFANIQKKHPRATLTIAGFGEALDSLRQLADRLGVKDSVTFAGRVDDTTRTKLLAEAWVAIQPSSIEGWGITVIEANACGTPVIASDVKGLRDSVLDGKTGILFPVNNVEKLTQAMESLIMNKALRVKLSQEAYIWSKGFDWEKSAKRFEQILLRRVRLTDLLGATYRLSSLGIKNYEI